MILTIGNSGVYEVAAFAKVKEILQEGGEDVLLFKQDRCLENESLAFGIEHNVPFNTITIDGATYPIEDFSAIWYLHPHLPRELIDFEPKEYRHFIHRQFEEMRRALWSTFREKRWINDPWAVMAAENKAYQLHISRLVGLEVPDTIITSNPALVREFYASHHGKIVVKTFATSPILDKVIYTNLVSAEDLAHIDTVRSSPSIFQSYVEKQYELRITVVGDMIFPVKVDSQKDEATALDWRRKPKLNDVETYLEPTTIPEEIRSKLTALMHRLQLRFGCIDMIVTPENRYVFLEINPNGQWYFVQLKTHVEIAEAIANLLITSGEE